MRELKFRGKSLDNSEWYYGDLIRFGGAQILHADGEFSSKIKTDKIQENTIGQFTGLKDNNGNDIYEGDILSFTIFGYNDNDEQHDGEVKYSDDLAEYVVEDINNYGVYLENAFELGWTINQDCEAEIIGNIYDNKELLEEKMNKYTIKKGIAFNGDSQFYKVKIKCPECGKICDAEVENHFPFASYVHECEHCGYMITESEWDSQEKIK